MIKNKRVFQPDHVSFMVSSLSVTLKRFSGLYGFFTKLSSLVGYGPANFRLTDEHRQAICEVFSAWPRLARMNFNDQPLDVPGCFAALLTPVIGHLTKLSLVRVTVCLQVSSIAFPNYVSTVACESVFTTSLSLCLTPCLSVGLSVSLSFSLSACVYVFSLSFSHTDTVLTAFSAREPKLAGLFFILHLFNIVLSG